MNTKKVPIILTGLLLVPTALAAVGPYVNVNPPNTQFHPISELWINENTVNWSNLNFINLNDVNATRFCIGTICVDDFGKLTWSYYQGSPGYIAIWQNSNTLGNSSIFENASGIYTSKPIIAPFFADYNNPSYYVNPSDTSKLNILEVAGNVSIGGNVLPASNLSSNLGSPSLWWNEAYINALHVSSLNGESPALGVGQSNYIAYWINNTTLGSTNIYYNAFTGYVGIGTISPQAKLHVSGDIIVTNVPKISDNDKVLTIDASGKISYIDTSSWDKSLTNEIQNVFTKIGNGTIFAEADNPTDTLTLQAGTGISISVDVANDVITITNTGDTDPSDDVTDSDLILDGNGRIIQIKQGAIARYINADKLDGKDWVDIGLCPSGQVLQGFDSNGNPVCVQAGAVQKAYTKITDGTNTATADTSDETIKFQAGSGISITVKNSTGTDVVQISHADTSSQSSVYNTGGTVIQNITLDEYGHITGIASVNLDNRYVQGAGSAGQIAFFTGTKTITGDNYLYWDDTYKRLGVGTNNPTEKLEVAGNVKASKFIDRDNTNYYIDPSNTGTSAVFAGSVKVGGSVYTSQICLTSDCSAKIYWDSTKGAMVITVT